MYTLIIKNATVIDGLGNAPFKADIGIEGGKIAAIGQNLQGECEWIDAAGLVVTPGFIDSHSHSDETVETFPDQKEKVEQGITFSITGQCGNSEAPVKREDGSIETVGRYFEKVKAIDQGSYSAMLVGHNALRRAVMGNDHRDPTEEELERMKDILREAFDAGAIGMSLGLFYVPGAYAKREEVVEICKVVAECGGVLAAHLRNESDGLLEAAEEYLDIIRASGCRAVFSHHKAMERVNFGKVNTTLAMIDEANRQGADIYLDVYPYRASSTSLIARFVPGELHPKGTTSVLDVLDDKKLCEDIKKWGNKKWGGDLSFALVTEYAPNPAYEGMTVSEIAEARGETDQYETILTLLRESRANGSGCFFSMSEEDVSRVIAHPRAMICTDSAAKGDQVRHHPRLVASFPRAIARYVRELKVVDLTEMIRRMTSLPAHVYGLKTKGAVRTGMDADLCVFDPERIGDRADFIHCSLPNEGIRYVVIDGKTVLKDGVYNGVRAARVWTRER